ncbi:hypothetical protein PPL_00364 [Heterostelium album PN500]|uniref:Uncharacterized protein n=1 Tax=Heterostelium pallidum (strain ATCC 26659 / Pp 5 / PN500) TaxID=670386 RepID=D3AW90_HETP5|nr:hypothetical protein PPL_00364 [Heterostelium album PN500]EFA86563.1 hypothetical protein PPL_00364 [Heterostelium album PN500]|eukprot:XP_020438668.1 hypothetical protein PPL_00364 [Heterostelium album PN500]
MLHRFVRSVVGKTRWGNRLTPSEVEGAGGVEYFQNEQEKVDTFKAFLATQIYHRQNNGVGGVAKEEGESDEDYYDKSSVDHEEAGYVAYQPIKDEELFLNYRFNPANPYPAWYHQPDIEEAKRRWGKLEGFSLRTIASRLF